MALRRAAICMLALGLALEAAAQIEADVAPQPATVIPEKAVDAPVDAASTSSAAAPAPQPLADGTEPQPTAEGEEEEEFWLTKFLRRFAKKEPEVTSTGPTHVTMQFPPEIYLYAVVYFLSGLALIIGPTLVSGSMKRAHMAKQKAVAESD